MPACGAGDLEVHVAEVVLLAQDVGQDARMRSPSLTRPMAMPATGLRDRHAGVHQASVPPQTVAIEEEPLDSRISETMRMV